MKNLVFPLFCMMLSTAHAQDNSPILQPIPQEIVINQKQSQTIAIPANYQIQATEGSCATALEALKEIMPNEGSSKDFTVVVGKKGDKAVKKFNKKIPAKKEGYYLKIEKDRIVIAGADQRGAFYGVQTLAQMLQEGSLTETEITDFPDIEFRGVVEGFYGTPWSHSARLRQLEFYGKNKMNTYIYGPKDDPYHSSPNWRKPYPENEAKQIHELVETAKKNEVDFVWAIHPGKDIKWTDEDRDALMNKFEAMYQLGVRSFAVFFDDIWGEGTNPQKQADLLNYLDNNFVQKKKDVTPLVMCPTEYNKSWSNVKGGYLKTLGDKLNPTIHIMWTGDRVIACIDKPTMEWINPLLSRKAYIWWNFPVSDYVRDHLLLGPVYGNTKDIKDDMSGFVANPMERAESSKIALYSVADYTWNLETYDSIQSWRRAIQDLLPSKAKYLEIFAEHNQDLGPNGHGFRRDESVNQKEILNALAQNIYDANAQTSVMKVCSDLETACDVLLADTENPALIEEMRPWLKQGKLLGEYGQCVLNMVLSEKDEEKFMTNYDRARSLQSQMYELDMTENQNPYQPGVKVGSLILLPTINKVYSTVTDNYNKKNGTKLETRAEYNPYTLSSDVPQLKIQPIRARHSDVNVSPSNEVIKWPAGAQVCVSVDQPIVMEHLTMDLGTKDVAGKFKCEVSADGKTWKAASLTQNADQTQITAQLKDFGSIQHIRIVSTENQEIQVYFKKFTLRVQKK